ncbi:hypothetical protein OHA25_08320 [Nonomuraea sp. NBC_00507]|uniref:hypothetical protein n=1 Tax=Nonomuraea sp. NBC_00507 TaxID=2976002 RepID=UPI002E196857
MSTALHDMIGTDPSPLDVADRVFRLVACEPGGLAVDGTVLGHELPQRSILLTELRNLLSSREVSNATRDVVWRHLVTRARHEGAQWLVGAVGVAVPALRAVSGRICRGYVAGDSTDIDTEVLARFIEALRTIDVDLPNILPRMRDAAKRAGQRARELAESDASRSFPLHESAEPPTPYGHPDLVLADAVAKGVVSDLDAELIALTRLEKRTLAEAAALLGLSTEGAKKRRQRAEPLLIDAVLAGEVESALSLTITSRLPRRSEEVIPETSARSRIASDSQPVSSEQKGGWGCPTGSARTLSITPRQPATAHWKQPRGNFRRRRFCRMALLVVAVVVVAGVVLAVAAGAALAATPAPPSDLNAVFTNLRNWLIGLLAALATLMLTIGGLRYLIAGGDPGEVAKAKTALKAAALGYGLAVLAPLFVNVLQRVVGGG